VDSLFQNIELLIQGQQFLAFVLVFAAGLLSAASPCVLAAIPLIIGYVGGYAEGNRKRAALFSAVFVMGLSLTFTLLGAAASYFGQLLDFLGNWLVYGFAALAILMGLHLMGIISVPLPLQRSVHVNRRGLTGAFLLGLLTGAVSSPCATPVLAVILGYASSEKNVLYGSILLFTYAIGHCALIFAAGLSIGIAESLINSRGVKNWAIYAKKISGAALICTGLYIGITLR
jgi:cytochrome c-type biogenesis protein